uniref:Predicted helicase n=1 Tax=Candidatus Kentrum sp. TUN TaxID=2126343 RepID=A0A450ZWK3_9GAMM|nr:MAG: Predicted helicase [Candidatus Kentron sp. TUN]
MPTPLQKLLDTYRAQSRTEREKGGYFEELIRVYLRHEPTYADLYSDVWLFGDWARQKGKDARDVGIDLVAKVRTSAKADAETDAKADAKVRTGAKADAETDEYHAIQCKFYARDHKVTRSDINSFFTASGQNTFTHRIIVSTTEHWSEHADDALRDQNIPVTKIDLQALEESQIDWSRYQPGAAVPLKPKKTPRPHQEKALADVTTGLHTADRGKLTMACGTGKTFTALRIAEAMAGAGRRVLFLVPSLSLLSQTLTEWTQESRIPLRSFAVCSDSEVGKKRKKDDDKVETFVHELRYPATTDACALAGAVQGRHDDRHMSVVFSTYHSIDVINHAQRDHALAAFDLIICDEAHRTTGATFTDENDSNFVKIHDADYIRAAKRLYMTATPRIYGNMAKVSQEWRKVALYSMDDPALYGADLHTLTFSEAVNRGLLVDYKVIILAMDEAHISRRHKTRMEKFKDQAQGGQNIGGVAEPATPYQTEIEYEPGELELAIRARIVQKCGRRTYWEEWAGDIARIAGTHITRIRTIIQNPDNKTERRVFREFVRELRDDLNPAITEEEVIEMLAQHLITKPIFEALFETHAKGNKYPTEGEPYPAQTDPNSPDSDRNLPDFDRNPAKSDPLLRKADEYSKDQNSGDLHQKHLEVGQNRHEADGLRDNQRFAAHNPVSQGMQEILDLLHEHHLEKETDTLEAFYASVKMRAEGIDSAAGKQKIILELYDKFFRNAFPRMTERLGIVYTPVEVVDFILHSIAHLLRQEFGENLGSPGVHILDPFTGTGTFISRLIQSGLIDAQQLPHKYHNEIHANEIVLLAYYIAAINIEAAYHGRMGDQMSRQYRPFPGICLTDTFQLHEQDDQIQDKLHENSRRRMHQKGLKEIRVIMGNPPYSIGQKSENDNNDNIEYPKLDNRIRTTYAQRSKAMLAKGLYDSYIRAIRWASDRIGDRGIIGFVLGGGFIEKPAMDGMRKTLADEFTAIHILNLRGDIRKNMLSKGRAQEGQNIFGSVSMTGIAITLFVKNPEATRQVQIQYCDIGDDLTREKKLKTIASFADVAGISAWQSITPDRHGDWLNQRDDSFEQFIVMGDKKQEDAPTLFENFSLGVATNRDAWCYNAGKTTVEDNMRRMIAFYNSEVARFNQHHAGHSTKERQTKLDGFINTDPAEISWTVNLKQELVRNRTHHFQPGNLITSLYRPFSKQWLYYNRVFNERVYQMPRIFPDAAAENLVICVSGIGARSGFSALISDHLPCLDNIEKGQCFPLYLYDQDGTNRRDAITDAGLAHFQNTYPEAITKEDIFYYCYGLLHAEDYRARYAANLTKQLLRIPAIKGIDGFKAFTRAGRELAHLHLNYETVEPYPDTVESRATEPDHYRVEKMRYAKTKQDGKTVNDRTGIVYNHRITVKDIPLAAYRYIVNGKSAVDWVMERQCVKTDKKSGITNDANRWAIETMNNPKYPLELLLRVITVSLETMKVVDGLQGLEI